VILHARANSVAGRPWLVWLHGFLGSRREWLPFAGEFTHWSQLWIDLPGHGGSAQILARDFADVSQRLRATLAHYGVTHYWLVGYSLGGRIAMYHACYGHADGLAGLVVEGGNPGLACKAGREQRMQSDMQWAQRLRAQPLPDVLDAWYRQPVFSDLTPLQRSELIALRGRNNPLSLAAMLEATSLARQPDLAPALRALTIPFTYLCGERDAKFRALAQARALPLRVIPAAGHNAHRENPGAFSNALREILAQADED
jgi:2-succinyl-6-hydroxy-2,4-cyclohexadiene-1-carboxylate synthase